MRIALVSPKGPLYRHRGGIFKKSLRYAPLTLTTLAAYVPAELGAEIELLDEGIDDVDPARIRADLAGITSITGNAPRAYELADQLRARGVTVVLGGPHPTLGPDEAQAHADAVVTGYAEQTWPALLRDFAAGRLQPRYAQGPELSLVGLPFPRRDLLPAERYFTRAVFEATRSCAHDCEFCVAPTAWGRKQYQKPPEEVAADIRQWGASKVLFIDLNLVSDPRYAARLFEALVPLGIRWYGLATTLLGLDRPLLALAARSGCRGLLMGLESLCEASLGATRKGFNDPEAYRALVADLHRHGIALMGCFAFGLDGDTPDVFDRTARFAVEAGIDLPRFAVVTPFPGTPLHRRLDAEGRILTRDWSLYDAQHVVFRPKLMTPRQLQEGHERAWRRAYSLPSIARRLWRSRVDPHLTLAANLGYRFYARNLHRFYTCDWFLGVAPEPVQTGRPAVAAEAPRGSPCG
ncbi:MAG TPA: radical SAM protein [Anaeromyxobacteraceae bacterium]|nr:radical SAM protein [Anaeromyxobacteraceae bacterium]